METPPVAISRFARHIDEYLAVLESGYSIPITYTNPVTRKKMLFAVVQSPGEARRLMHRDGLLAAIEEKQATARTVGDHAPQRRGNRSLLRSSGHVGQHRALEPT